MVDILACPEELALTIIHKRLEIIDYGMIEIKEDMKGLRMKIVGNLQTIEDS